jgi:hypothetical protein
MKAINAVSYVSNMANAGQAALNGDPSQAILMVGQAALRGAGPGCQSWGNFALGAFGTVTAASTGIDRIMNGDVIGGALDLFSAAVSANRMLSCFTGETPLLTPYGSQRIDQFRPGDLVLSRSESDPNGPIEAKRVEEVFVRLGRILHLHVGGQLIRTTPEHPFYINNKGWLDAGQLQIGDWLASHDGRWVAVEEVFDTGEHETVYNLRVADWHTYFVGSPNEWGFSVWAHNVSPACAAAANTGNRVHYDSLNGGTGSALPTELSAKYPNTTFQFTRRGAAGADVMVLPGGMHPSAYQGSTSAPGNNYADFKPNTASGTANFNRRVSNGRLPANTELLPYDPVTGNLI